MRTTSSPRSSDGTPRVEVAIDGWVATISLCNSNRGNAVSRPMLAELAAAIVRLQQSDVRAAVIRGAGRRNFCTGYDLEALEQEIAAGHSVLERDDHPMEAVFQAMDAAPFPFVAALRGAVFGAGGEIAAAADLRVGTANLLLAMPPTRLGLVYSHTGLARFVETLGMPATRRLFLTGDRVGSDWLLRNGFLTAIVPDVRLVEDAWAMATRIAAGAPLAVSGMRRILNDHLRPKLQDEAALADIRALRERAFSSRDMQEGIAAALAKRVAEFEGR